MLNNLSLILSGITAATAIIAIILAIITLIYLARQTKHVAEQTKYLGNQIEQNTTISIRQYYQNVNVQLLQHQEEAKSLLGETKEDAMASIILGALQFDFDLNKKQNTDNPSWKIYFEDNLSYVMRQEHMRQHWEHNKHLYEREFVDFIDQTLQELDFQKHTSSKVS